ncbi:hypothetical protein AYO38_05125 [bacterium SCGC AG-212-C10]|nr:hypothetical protein AYO38_05125 [bacterium SCGC AG-212-C10]
MSASISAQPAVDAEAIAACLESVRDRIEAASARAGRDWREVTLIAVSKGQPVEAILAAAACGVTDFGENRVQEALAKLEQLGGSAEAAEVRIHLIGHLQTNKVRDAMGRFAVVQTIDSERLLRAISAHAAAPVACMLQVNVASDPAKYGFAPEATRDMVALARSLPGISLVGLMTVPQRADDPEAVRPHFAALRELAAANNLPGLSMGMTEDFEVAIEEGATHVRVGRAIFGERQV